MQGSDCLGTLIYSFSGKTSLAFPSPFTYLSLLLSLDSSIFQDLVSTRFPPVSSKPSALQRQTFIDNCCKYTFTSVKGRFHPYWTVSIRHLVTCVAQIGTCWMVNEKDGRNLLYFCLSHRRHSVFLLACFVFLFFIMFTSFKMKAWKTPLKWRMVAR